MRTHRQSTGRVLSTHKLDFDSDVSCRCQPVDKVEPLRIQKQQIPMETEGEMSP